MSELNKKYKLPPNFKVLTAYNHPALDYDKVIIAEVKDAVAFCEFGYDSSLPIRISYEKKVTL